MRYVFAAIAWIGFGAGASAEDNPACAKYKNDFEYNACLAKLGPKAAPTHAEVAHGPATHGKHGRMRAVFTIEPRK